MPLAVFLVDALMMACAILVAVQTRGHLALFGRNAELTSTVGIVAASMLFAWLLVITLTGGYEPEVFDVGVEEYKRVLRGTIGAAAVVGIACYLLKYDLSRAFFVLSFCLGVVLL